MKRALLIIGMMGLAVAAADFPACGSQSSAGREGF